MDLYPSLSRGLVCLGKRLKSELEKKKGDRSKSTLKHTIKEIKNWEKFIKEHKKGGGRQCPHCGGSLEEQNGHND